MVQDGMRDTSGGVLSLLKFVAFIDPLIRDLKRSTLGGQVTGIPTSPVGYADDMSTACISKVNVDKSLALIDQYAKKWRYSYNAKKSAILVFGDTHREHGRGAKFRNFSLGRELWVLKGEEIEELRKFQRYIGRRCQRYPKRSPNYSAYTPLGWMSIDRVII